MDVCGVIQVPFVSNEDTGQKPVFLTLIMKGNGCNFLRMDLFIFQKLQYSVKQTENEKSFLSTVILLFFKRSSLCCFPSYYLHGQEETTSK